MKTMIGPKNVRLGDLAVPLVAHDMGFYADVPMTGARARHEGAPAASLVRRPDAEVLPDEEPTTTWRPAAVRAHPDSDRASVAIARCESARAEESSRSADDLEVPVMRDGWRWVASMLTVVVVVIVAMCAGWVLMSAVAASPSPVRNGLGGTGVGIAEALGWGGREGPPPGDFEEPAVAVEREDR